MVPINVVLQDEHGETIAIAGGDGVLEILTGPVWNDPTSNFLRFIDPHGNTILNHLQAGPFRRRASPSCREADPAVGQRVDRSDR